MKPNQIIGIVDITLDTPHENPEFSIIASELSSIQPSATVMASYTPTNHAPSSCTSVLTVLTGSAQQAPTQTTVIQIATALPQKPDLSLCSCMMESLNCTAG